MALRRIVKSRRIIPHVEEVSLVDSAANGAKMLLMKAGVRTDVLPPELAGYLGKSETTELTKPGSKGDLARDIEIFMAAWR